MQATYLFAPLSKLNLKSLPDKEGIAETPISRGTGKMGVQFDS